jgi:hypothetical protein
VGIFCGGTVNPFCTPFSVVIALVGSTSKARSKPPSSSLYLHRFGYLLLVLLLLLLLFYFDFEYTTKGSNCCFHPLYTKVSLKRLGKGFW